MALVDTLSKVALRDYANQSHASRHFQLGEGPSRGLLRDCENRWIYDLESVSTNAIYIIPVSMTLQRTATMQA